MTKLSILLAPLIALSTSACHQVAPLETTTDSATNPQIAAGTITAPANLVGEYRLVGVDGQDIDLPHGISASIMADMIVVESDCVRLAWSYRFEGAGLITAPIPTRTCRRGLLPAEQAISAAFDSAREVRRTDGNGVQFIGGRHSVTLFGQ